ncbi:PCMD domain-containing protein [uncultured Bacteroides sp.]|uniref:PCMD domain-containing protein n=1 Tax=uncultured Bacteroides sp. TaxID=162156 RepID=UPI002636635D|nr:PCMD domain-containing protein [uncultured Bacteroides sp.]
MLKKILYILLFPLALSGCKIDNDIPYPLIEGNIESFEVEGQCAGPSGNSQASINTTDKTVTLYVDDSVDLSKLRITRFNVSSDAEILIDSAYCADFAKFPKKGFTEPSNLADTRINFKNPVRFTLRTYQDYVWTVTVTQLIEREIDVNGMVSSVVDVEKRSAIIYVSADTDISNLQVNKMELGGKHGKVSPDPTTIHDYTSPQTFYVSYGWEETFHDWKVYVYHDKNSDGSTAFSDVFPMTSRAYLNGTVQSGMTPVVQYRESGAGSWNELSSSEVTVNGTKFQATFTKLNGATKYDYRVNVNGVEGETKSFTTAPATELPNGSFDYWSNTKTNTNRTLWQPWAEGLSESDFWDTGNKGATTIGESNSIPTEETAGGSGKAALLQSKWAVLKLAAGNIFAGKYVKTDGTNGVLSFGRPFNAFPTALRFKYKYTNGAINRSDEASLNYLKGRPDSCIVYIALSDKSEPYEIKTRPSERKLFNKNDANVIAYGEFICGQSNDSYKEIEIKLDYRAFDRTPKYIVLVAAASKYGDYFVGCDETKFWLDDMELVYE